MDHRPPICKAVAPVNAWLSAQPFEGPMIFPIFIDGTDTFGPLEELYRDISLSLCSMMHLSMARERSPYPVLPTSPEKEFLGYFGLPCARDLWNCVALIDAPESNYPSIKHKELGQRLSYVASTAGVKIVFTTNSPDILNAFDPTTILVSWEHEPPSPVDRGAGIAHLMRAAFASEIVKRSQCMTLNDSDLSTILSAALSGGNESYETPLRRCSYGPEE